MSLLEVSVEARDSGPVVVLAGEADHSSITQLNEVLTAHVSARTSHLTIDVTNLRSADPAFLKHNEFHDRTEETRTATPGA